jgi:hypothetical protein
MTSFKGQARWANITSRGGGGGKLIALERHTTEKVNKAEELTYLYTNIVLNVQVFSFSKR